MDSPLRIVMTPFGSSGDVHPYIGIGERLRQHGHEVVVITAASFRGVAERAGLTMVDLVTAEEFEEATSDPDLWRSHRGLRVVLSKCAEVIGRLHDRLEEVHAPGRTVLVGHPLSFATRIFEEQHRVPAVTCVLAPSNLRSLHEVPAHAPGRDASGLPTWVKRGVWWLIDRLLIDPHLEPGLNVELAARGLPRVRRPFAGWLLSPRRVLGLFPEWFGARQPDWPSCLVQTGFPLFDERDRGALAPDLARWITSGPPPLVFTPGSANRQAERFFAAAAGATRELGGRALFLTRYPEQVPADLPSGVRHERFVPLSLVLPRAAALVHHGGIGTLAQALAAGVPQLIMPMAFDQPDNATRLMRLGVANALVPRHFTPSRVAAVLRRLLESPAVTSSCAELAARINPESDLEATCRVIERLAPQSPP